MVVIVRVGSIFTPNAMETKPSPSFGMAFFKSSKLAATAVGLPILVSDYCVFFCHKNLETVSNAISGLISD